MIGYFFLFVILAIGLLSKSSLLIIASIILSLLKIMRLNFILNFLDGIGIKLGLLFLLLSVLVPIVNNNISFKEIIKSYRSFLGVSALVSGILATQIIGMGLELLESEPELIVGMLFGSIIGIVFFDGVPVGPLLTGGLTALFYRVYSLLFN